MGRISFISVVFYLDAGTIKVMCRKISWVVVNRSAANCSPANLLAKSDHLTQLIIRRVRSTGTLFLYFRLMAMHV